ncbi:MAG: PorV/PorQ family protein [candidate division KSB1 bacterium]|nr:PorV/PorQ family protein [candidate division KSB1 bacterium]
MNFKRITLLLLLLTTPLFAQTRSGAAFLKIAPGSRHQSMAGAYTSMLDDPYALYANPAATGFLREWHYSAGYTKWLADISNASLLTGWRVPMPWSRQTRIAAGVLYKGIPDFNNSFTVSQAVSSEDVLVSLGIGQPLTFLSDYVSVGANLKYYRSRLASYNADALIFDTGVMVRTPRFQLAQSYDMLFSVGGSVNQTGRDLIFLNTGTPLPRTVRGGISCYIGSHHGFQFTLLADYVDVLDKEAYVTLGSEIMIDRYISLYGGYNLGADLFERFSFGASVRLEDVRLHLDSVFPGANKAFRLDLSSLDEDNVFARTYRGTAALFPVRPEYFMKEQPLPDDTLAEQSVVLEWEASRDRDLFDDHEYWVIVDQDSNAVKGALDMFRDTGQLFKPDLLDSALFYSASNRSSEFVRLDNLPGGHYYWAIIAYDKDGHYRIAEQNSRPVGHFYVPLADLHVKNFNVQYHDVVTRDDFHGTVSFSIANSGDRTARDIRVKLVDQVVLLDSVMDIQASAEWPQIKIDLLKAGKEKKYKFDWRTPKLGQHQAVITIETRENIKEWNSENNVYKYNLFTIPKGGFEAPDTAVIHLTSEVSIKLPIITEVNFDIESTEVPFEYLNQTNMDPHLKILANRLVKHPNLSVQLQGYVDPNTENADSMMAVKRSQAVRDSLIRLGVASDQIQLMEGVILPERRTPYNRTIRRWIHEERRYVKITAVDSAQAVLFKPVLHTDIERLQLNVNCLPDIHAYVPMDSVRYRFKAGSLVHGTQNSPANPFYLGDTLKWKPKKVNLPQWNGKTANAVIQITDSLGRFFRTPVQQIALIDRAILRENRTAVPLKFSGTDPTYSFYWERIFDQARQMFKEPGMRLKFEGHACAIDPFGVNPRLSQRRAETFHQGFINYMKEHHPAALEAFQKRLEPPRGYAENQPLGIKRLRGEFIMLGDNDMPIGRKLNRRIEIVFYLDRKSVQQP